MNTQWNESQWPTNALVSDDFANYLAAPCEQSSTIKHAIKSVRHYHWFKQAKLKETEAQAFGTMIHTAILTPELWDDKYIVFDPDKRPNPDQTFGAKINKEWKDTFYAKAEAEGKIVIDKDRMENFETIMEVFQGSHYAEYFQSNDGNTINRAEHSIYTPLFMDMMHKVRIDFIKEYYDEHGELERVSVREIKSCDDSHPDGFLRDIYNYRYDIQAYMQMTALGSLLPDNVGLDFKWLAIATKPPFGIQEYKPSYEALEKAKKDFQVACATIYDYKQGNNDVPVSYFADAVFVDVPSYMKKHDVDPF